MEIQAPLEGQIITLDQVLNSIKNSIKCGVDDKNILNLAEKIPETLIQSRSSNTAKNYFSQFKKRHLWTEKSSEIKSLPANISMLLCFWLI